MINILFCIAQTKQSHSDWESLEGVLCTWLDMLTLEWTISVTTQLPCRWEIARKENICSIHLVKLYYPYFVQSHISLAVHPHFPASKVYSLQCLGNREGLSDLYVFFVLFSVEKIRQAFTFTAWLQNHFSLLWSCGLLIHMTFFMNWNVLFWKIQG